MNKGLNQFSMNSGILENKDLIKLDKTTVLLVGLGGLGGHIANGLTRLGVKNFILVDYDKFDISNINRQLFSNHETVNKDKTEVVKDELYKINSNIHVKTITQKVQSIYKSHFKEVDMIIDAVDNIETKKYLESLSQELNIPLLHGACGGWYGQVSIIKSKENLLEKIYQNSTQGLEKDLLNPYFAPSITASYMISEFIKWIKDEVYIYNQLLLIDTYNDVLTKVKLGGNHG